MREDSAKQRVTSWIPDLLRPSETEKVMVVVLTERCDKHESSKKYSDFLTDPMPFKEDESWSVIYLKKAYEKDRYPKLSQAQECLLHTQASWKYAVHGTSPWNLFAILMDGPEDSSCD